jgi:8-oxo-dGTP diphosphatase
MNRQDYQAYQRLPLGVRSVCYLMRGSDVLLGKKKEGKGRGMFVGIGGKAEPGETVDQALIRELEEEVAVIPLVYQQVAKVRFIFPHDPGWSQEVVAFICKQWRGEPVESAEIAPEWFSIGDLPYAQMWADAPFWLPMIFTGSFLDAVFVYDRENKLADFQVNPYVIQYY